MVTNMRERTPAVYIMASARNGTLYIGVTSDLPRRAWQHQHNEFDGFTKKYAIHLLVYYEIHDTMYAAIEREKQLKKWRREWKLRLIEEMNPGWRDLVDEL